MSKKAWLYFLIVPLAAGVVAGAKVWIGKNEIHNPPESPLALRGEERVLPIADPKPDPIPQPETLPGKVLLDVPFTAQAPFREWDRRVIVVIGYDETSHEFITNDAGIMRGRQYRYPQKVFMSAAR